VIEVDKAEFTINRLTSVATLSNCGEFLKPSDTKQLLKDSCGRGNDLGYGKSTEGYIYIYIMDNPQPSPKS
jgi:hypothetical protein